MVAKITCPNCGHVLTTLAGLTVRQRQLFDFIKSSEDEDDAPVPSYDEMAKSLNLRSKSNAHRLVVALENKGYIARRHYHGRSIHTVKGLAI